MQPFKVQLAGWFEKSKRGKRCTFGPIIMFLVPVAQSNCAKVGRPRINGDFEMNGGLLTVFSRSEVACQESHNIPVS